MASISSPLFVITILSLALLFSVSAAEGGRKGGPITGGWQPIKDPNDPSVVEIGKFAVSEHNKQTKQGLTFLKVIRGATQVVSGTNYEVIISARNGTAVGDYEAVVWDKPWEHFRQLTSFKPAYHDV